VSECIQIIERKGRKIVFFDTRNMHPNKAVVKDQYFAKTKEEALDDLVSKA